MNLRRALLVSGLAAFFIVPVVAFGEGIVPQCSGGDGPYCQACDLVHLINNLIRFAISFTVIVATIMFVYAGFLYVTAAARTENLQKARSVFTSVFVGLVLVLTAWLIVDLVLTVLTPHKDGFGFWVNIDCVHWATGSDAQPSTLGSGNISGGGGLPYDSGAEASMRTTVLGMGIGINNPPCTTPESTNCTNVGGLNNDVLTGLTNIKNQCNNCSLTITGGTEQGQGHSGHTGSQVDLRKDPNLISFLSDPAVRQRLGITYYQEESDHLHIRFGGGG